MDTIIRLGDVGRGVFSLTQVGTDFEITTESVLDGEELKYVKFLHVQSKSPRTARALNQFFVAVLDRGLIDACGRLIFLSPENKKSQIQLRREKNICTCLRTCAANMRDSTCVFMPEKKIPPSIYQALGELFMAMKFDQESSPHRKGRAIDSDPNYVKTCHNAWQVFCLPRNILAVYLVHVRPPCVQDVFLLPPYYWCDHFSFRCFWILRSRF